MRVPLERFTAGLHQYHDEAGERLHEDQSGYDGQHRYEIGREPPPKYPTQRLPDHRRTRKCQPHAPKLGCSSRRTRYIEEQSTENKKESPGGEEVEAARQVS